MPIILVPYHLDEYLPDLHTFLPPDLAVTPVTASPLPDGDMWVRLGSLYDSVAGVVAEAARHDRPPIVVSGDCTVSLGVMAGLQRAGVDAGIVWFDAHGDVQSPETTTSGYIGGMPLRLLVGHRPELISQRLGLRVVSESRALLVGARDLDPAEVDYLATAEIGRSSVEDLSTEALPGGPLLLHLDLDVVTADDLAGLRYPVPAGPAASLVIEAARRVLATGRVAAMDIACTWHPDADDPSGSRSRIVESLIPQG